MNGQELLYGVFPEYREALRALYEKAGGKLSALLDTDENGLISLGAEPDLAHKLTLIAPLSREYFRSENEENAAITDSEKACDYLAPFFTGVKSEKLVAVYLNGRGEVLAVKETDGGTSDAIGFEPAECVRDCVRLHARAVVLAHNHPQGFAVPSAQDIRMTDTLFHLLKDIGITLCEHIIFAGNDHCLLSATGGGDYLAFRQ